MDDDLPEPSHLRFLRRMVTVLTTVMIVGVVVVIGLLVTRLSRDTPVLPEAIVLPDGAKAVAFTQAADWYAVVTDAGEILVFDRMTGELRQTVVVE
jgi:ABC-type polysaccharide transport system permease subunit